jgi:coenzyme F420 hydrogenase subunit beta
MAAKEKYVEPTYLECGFGELEHKVIAPKVCCLCGSCVAFCPRIALKERKPTLVEYDPLCGLCYAYCPRSFLDMAEMETKLFGRTRNQDEALGIYKKVIAAKATPVRGKVQDGGVVTALLIHALETEVIDCAVVTSRNDRWQSGPRVATTPEEIIAAAGTKYTITPSVVGVKMALEQGFSKIGFVGTPCQIQALRKAKLLDEPYDFGQERIALLVGLFCMENFEYGSLMEGLVKGIFGLQPQDVEKFQISKGMFTAITKAGERKEVPLEKTDEFTWQGCGPCFDFSAELADVSVGSVGSPEGWSTVLTRTDLGAKLFEDALSSGKMETKDISEKGLALVKRLAGSKAARFQKCSLDLQKAGVKFDVSR